MSMTLPLIDRLMERGRNLQLLGQDREAACLFRRVTGFRELPVDVAEETQCRLAELQLRRRRYRRARRHLVAALRHRPDCAYYHRLLATAIDAEETGDPRRAARHYRRSLQLDAHQPDTLIEYGLFNLREGRIEAGLTCLRRAAALSPDDVEAVRQLSAGLTTAGRPDDARAVLRDSLFRNPRDARFQKLWNDFRFEQTREQQGIAGRDTMEEKPDEGPVVLPFVQADRTTVRVEGRLLRQDPPSPVTPPHSPQPSRRSDQRHAQ